MSERLDHNAVMDTALDKSIEDMIEELGNPPLIDKIFPDGWQNAPRQKRIELHQLCLRTFSARSRQEAANAK